MEPKKSGWKKRIRGWQVIVCMLGFLCLWAVPGVQAAATDYGNSDSWVYLGSGEKEADIFFLCPTVVMGTADQPNMAVEDENSRRAFRGATNMEKGIYEGWGNFYAPYYRQVGLSVYTLEPAVAGPCFAMAYEDVRTAFSWYLKERNNGRPVVLAGFSQGADMVLRLLKEYGNGELKDKLVAAYVIGWRVTPEDTRQYPWLKMAQGEGDTGVIISFNTESPSVATSLIVPGKTLSINPLNWRTDGMAADRSLNRGGVFTDYNGHILKEVPFLTGAYLEENRGALKVTDISEEEYAPVVTMLFDKGVYHVYDYQFFYRNLQENVGIRIDGFRRLHQLRPAS